MWLNIIGNITSQSVLEIRAESQTVFKGDYEHLIIDVQPGSSYFIVTTISEITILTEASFSGEICVEHYCPNVFFLKLELMIRS